MVTGLASCPSFPLGAECQRHLEASQWAPRNLRTPP